MHDETFRVHRDKATVKRYAMCDAKSLEYTRGNADDRLCNFKRVGSMVERIKDPTYLAWAVYFLKHVDALLEYLATGKEGTEGIEGRIDDAQNYLDLGRELIREGKERQLIREQLGKTIRDANMAEDCGPGMKKGNTRLVPEDI